MNDAEIGEIYRTCSQSGAFISPDKVVPLIIELNSARDARKSIVRENLALKKTLKEHTETAKKVVAALDAEMKKPSDEARGARIAKITNALEFNNDSARHFGLGEPFPLSR